MFGDAFAEFEGEAAPVIRDIIFKRALPVDIEQLQILFNFVAFQAVRTPAMRRTISAPISHTRRIIADIVLSSPERFAAAMRQAGQDPKQLSYESLDTLNPSRRTPTRAPLPIDESLNDRR